MEVGFIGEGICADAYNYLTNTIGLQYLCNTNNGNAYNFWDRRVDADIDHSPEHTMRTNQGEMNAPAANVFDQTCGFEGHYKRTSPNGVLRYIYGTAPQAEPVCYTTLATSPVSIQPAASEPTVPCPQRNYLPRGVRSFTEMELAQSALLAEKLAYGTTRYIYDQLLDGGSTDEVVQEIQSTWPADAWNLRTSMLSRSPFLSVEALMGMVERNVMPSAMVAEVLIANPEATRQDGFVEWLQEKSGHPLPTYLLAAVVSSWDQNTYRTTLEAEMGTHHAAMTQQAHMVMEHWRSDTLYEHVDSLRGAWQLLRTPAARYAEALTYLQEGNATAAFQVVDQIPVERELRGPGELERQRMLGLIAFCAAVFADARTMAQLNEGEVNALEAIVDNTYDRPATWAQNLLRFAYERCRTPLTGGDGTRRPSFLIQLAAGEPVLPHLAVAPNPASAWVAFSVRLNNTPNNAQLLVRDLMGRLVWQSTVGAPEQQILWDCRSVETGSYTVELMNGGALVATSKFIAQR